MQVREFIGELERANRALTIREFGRQLNSAKKRLELSQLVETYFDAVRPTFASSREQGEVTQPVDAAMQALLIEGHKRGQTSRYKKLLTEAREALIQVDAARLLPSVVELNPVDGSDSQILSALDRMLPSAALAYLQAIEDLKQNDRYSWRGPATDLRECMREVLDQIAPDREVEGQAGYKKEPDARGPTMKQKVRYVLRKRDVASAATASVESAVLAVEEALGVFVRSVYTRSSVSTHTATSRDEVLRIKSLVQVVLQELLELRD
jgi:hypothetical protein